MPRREYDLPALHAGIKRVARAQAELSPDSTGKNDLPLAGHARLHRKNILPHRASDLGHLARVP